MILLGPGGTTALDLWVTAIASASPCRRSISCDAATLRAPREERRGLPVDFLALLAAPPLRRDAPLVRARGRGRRRFVLARRRGRRRSSRWTTGASRAPESTFAAPRPAAPPAASWTRRRSRPARPRLRATVRYHQRVDGPRHRRSPARRDAAAPRRPRALEDPDGAAAVTRCATRAPSPSARCPGSGSAGARTAPARAGEPARSGSRAIPCSRRPGCCGPSRPRAPAASSGVGARRRPRRRSAPRRAAPGARRARRACGPVGGASGWASPWARRAAGCSAPSASSRRARAGRGDGGARSRRHLLRAARRGARGRPASAALARRTQVLAACAASTIALGIGLALAHRGACDVVLAGGYDGVSVFVASGFEALRATTGVAAASLPRSAVTACRSARARRSWPWCAATTRAGARVLARVARLRRLHDAVHITAPDRTGSASRAPRRRRSPTPGMRRARRSGERARHRRPRSTTPWSRAPSRASSRAPRPPWSTRSRRRSGTPRARPASSSRWRRPTRCDSASPPPPRRRGRRPLDPDAPALLLDRAEATRARGRRSSSPRRSAARTRRCPGAARRAERRARPRAAPRRVPPRVGARGGGRPGRAVRGDGGRARPARAPRRALPPRPRGRRGARRRGRARGARRGAGIVAGQALATLDTNEGYDARRRARGPDRRSSRASSRRRRPTRSRASAPSSTGSPALASRWAPGSTAAPRRCRRGGAGRRRRRRPRWWWWRPTTPGPPRAICCGSPAGAAARSRRGRWRSCSRPTGGAVCEVGADVAAHDGDGPVGHLALVRWLDARGSSAGRTPRRLGDRTPRHAAARHGPSADSA